MNKPHSSFSFYFNIFLAVLLLLSLLAFIILDVYLFIKHPSPIERFVAYYPYYIVAWMGFIVFWLHKRIRVSQNLAKEKQEIEKNDSRLSIVNSSEYEKYFIVHRLGIKDEITEQLAYYLEMVEISEAVLKIAEANGMTIVWFFDKDYFLDFIEIITSLQESFKDDSIAYLKHKDRDKSYYIYNNHYRDDYLLLPCITEAGQTGFFPYPKKNSVKDIECIKAGLQPNYSVQRMINHLKSLDIQHLNYKIVKIPLLS